MCYKHDNEGAVGQCLDCGRGLCKDCSGRFNNLVCENCVYQGTKYVDRRIRNNLIISMIPVLIIGYIAYRVTTPVEGMPRFEDSSDFWWTIGGTLFYCYYAWSVLIGRFFYTNILPANGVDPANTEYHNTEGVRNIICMVLAAITGPFVAPVYIFFMSRRLNENKEMRRYIETNEL